MDEMSTAMASGIKLNKPSDWPKWFLNIEYHARLLDVWDIIDPDETIISEKAMLGKFDNPRTEDILEEVLEERALHFRFGLPMWEDRGRSKTRGERPSEPGAPTQKQIALVYQDHCLGRRQQRDSGVDALNVENVVRIHNLITSSVNDDIYCVVLYQLKSEGQHGVRAMLQALREWAAPIQDQPVGEWEWVVD